jgi:hypothetical protein
MTKRNATVPLDYPADHVWAYAVEAHRANGGYYKKTEWDSDDNGDIVQTRVSNKEMVLSMLKSLDKPNNAMLAAGQEYREFWQGQMLQLLTDGVNDFVKTVIVVAEKDTIESELELSVVVSCIESADKQKKNQQLEHRKRSLNSGWRYSVGSPVEFRSDVEVICCRYLDKIGAYAVDSIIDGDLYFWWSQRDVAVKTYKYLTARVKKTDVDFYTKVPVTQLNYVKVL